MLIIKPETAAKVKQLIQRRPGETARPQPAGGHIGYPVVTVRCTSTTAAAASGVGAQCYPAVIVTPLAGETAQPESGEVWLTLLGPGGARRPRAGGIYSCVLTGSVEAATDDERPRAFATDFAGPSEAGVGAWLSLPECATLEVVEAYGACECITTGQTASLTRSGAALASDDLLYGCPPGATNADCPNGAPSKFNLVVAGFTGGSTGYNGNWTLSYTATPTPRWTQTRNGVTWTATVSAGENATLRGDDGVSEPSYEDTSVTTCCESITLNLDDGGSSEDPPATLTLTPATACGNGPAYTPYLTAENDDCGPCLKLLWIPVAGSGAASVKWRLIGCGVDANGKRYAEFASDSPLICTDDAEECGENYVVVRVTCELCVDVEILISCCSTPLDLPTVLCLEDGTATARMEYLTTTDGTVYYRGTSGEDVYQILICGTSFIDCSLTITAGQTGFRITKNGSIYACGYITCATGLFTVVDGAASGGGPPVTVTVTADSDCESNPPSPSYNCVTGACVEVYDGSGEYATEAECTATCEGGGGGGGEPPCTGDVGATAKLVIPDGPSAGTYYAAWTYSSAGIPLLANFEGVPGVDFGDVFVVYNSSPASPLVAGYLIGYFIDEVEYDDNADSATCSPSTSIVFPGGGLSTGDIEVTTI